MAITGILELKNCTPMFDNGRHRVVYQHPENAELIVKVVRPKWGEQHAAFNSWKKRFKPLRENSINMHEFHEMMRLDLDINRRTPHLLTTLGMVRTDLGWGMVCELEKDVDGTPAKSVCDLGEKLKDYIPEFKEFCNAILNSRVVLTSCHRDNVVLAWREGHYEFVIIDGIGERTAIPLRTYFPSINKKKNLKRLHGLTRSLKIFDDIFGEN